MGKNVIVENENKINLDWFVFEPTDFGICGYRRQSFSHADIRPYCRGDKVTVDLYYWTSETARYPEGTQRKVRYRTLFRDVIDDRGVAREVIKKGIVGI